ncbi:unnamed protein product [Prunus armeniaca]|uniref:Uncharacterized protein n=1 Tax=Prunus armeniaca TaxID=36596 RepID=A0A6J5UKQ9_PRUAR|nr:unnamed protein product [Prunus armeniaca]
MKVACYPEKMSPFQFHADVKHELATTGLENTLESQKIPLFHTVKCLNEHRLTPPCSLTLELVFMYKETCTYLLNTCHLPKSTNLRLSNTTYKKGKGEFH